MPKHLISTEYNEFTGLTEEFWHDPAAGTITIRYMQDIEPMLKANQQEFNGYSSKGHHNFNEGIGRKVASIPPGAVLALKKMGYDLDTMRPDAIKKMLNDRDFAKFRTAPGRL